MAGISLTKPATGDGFSAEASARVDAPPNPAARITVEHAVYAAVVSAGGLIRFAGLAHWPLSMPEAVQAWSAWQAVQGVDSGLKLLPESAALRGLLSALFFLGANDDFWVRFVPAAFGTALIILPWWWRRFLGRWSALWLALLFAISPWLIASSRFADGTALALLAFFLALTGMQQLVMAQRGANDLSQRREPWSIIIGASVGFMVATGVLAWSLSVVLALFAWAYRRDLQHSTLLRARTGLACLVAFVIGASGGLLHPDGFGLVAASLGVWLGRLQGAAEPGNAYLNLRYDLVWPLVRLLVDQSLLVVFGVGGLLHLIVRRKSTDFRWPVILWVWLAWALLLCLLPGRSPRDLYVLLLPLTFGTAHAFAALCNAIPAQQARRDGLAVFATLAVLLVSLTFWAAGVVSSREFDAEAAQAVLVVLSLAVLILFVYGWWASWSEAYWLCAVMLATYLLLFTFSGAWQLGHRQNLTQPDGFMAEITHPEVRQLVEDIETLSAQRTGDPFQLAISVEDTMPAHLAVSDQRRLAPDVGPHPVLGWYLRNFRNVTWSSQAAVPAGSRPSPLVITYPDSSTGDNQANEGMPEGYAGSKYGLAATWLPADLANQNEAPADYPDGWDGIAARFREAWRTELQPWLRWALYRRVNVQPAVESVILWANPSP